MIALPFTLLLAATVAAGDPGRFTVHARSGGPQTGRLLALTTDGRISLLDPPADITPGDVYALRQVGRPLPAWPRSSQLILANGDRIAGILAGGDGPRVRVRPAVGGDVWAVPLSSLAALWVLPPPAETPPDPARYPWRPAGKRGDVVLLANGDTLEGTVEALSADGSEFRFASEPGKPVRVVPTNTVAAVAFDPTLARVRKPKGQYYRVVTADGSRVSASAITTEGATFAGTTLFGAKFHLPAADVVAVDVVQGKAAFLSDLKPIRAVVEGYAGPGVPWAADRTAKGLPLRLAGPDGGWFDKGVGTHPRTTLVYDLGGKYRRFEALVGLDPATGRRGAAVARVLVDGKPASIPGLELLTAASLPVVVRADVTGAKELTLVVDFGPSGDVQADVNWADARLVE